MKINELKYDTLYINEYGDEFLLNYYAGIMVKDKLTKKMVTATNLFSIKDIVEFNYLECENIVTNEELLRIKALYLLGIVL